MIRKEVNLYNFVSTPLANRRDVLTDRVQCVHETASSLYKRIVDNIGYEQERLKNIAEKGATKDEKKHRTKGADERRSQFNISRK